MGSRPALKMRFTASVWVVVVLCVGLGLADTCTSRTADGLHVRFDAWGTNSIRVRIGANPSHENLQQALLPQSQSPTSIVQDSCVTTSGNLRAEQAAGGAVRLVRVSDGALLVSELSRFSGNGSRSIVFASTEDERLFGLGEHRTGKLNNKGIQLDFMDAGVYDHHQGSDIVLPFYLSSRQYGFLWNHASFGGFNSSSNTTTWTTTTTQVLDFWVTTGSICATDPSCSGTDSNPYKQLMSSFADVTGHPPAMPHFATGFWQCKNRCRSQEELLSVAREYKARQLPISTIVIDYLHWEHFGDFSLNPQCWPDPKAMVTELDGMGIRVMISIWPFVQSGSVHGNDYNASGASTNFQPMLDGGMLVRDNKTGEQTAVFHNPFWESNPPTNHMYVMDPFNPATRKYVFNQLKQNYMRYGIKTFWLDEAEPERHTQDINIRYKYHDGTDNQVGLAWSRAEQQMISEGLLAEGLEQDEIFMLSRSFFIGGAKYGAGAWSGDIPSTFDSFHQQVRIAQNVAVSGLYWWTTDIGGYSGGDAQDPVMKELLIRWFQFGAFCPMFRLHGDRKRETITQCGRSGAPNEVWHYGDAAYKSIQAIMHLRESLRDYVSDAMLEANKTGVPAVRPLFLEFPSDKKLWELGELVGGAYMFGAKYLVCPVTTFNVSTWDVYLPALPQAEHWTHYYTNATFAGGQLVTIDVRNLDTFPLFVRGPNEVNQAALLV